MRAIQNFVASVAAAFLISTNVQAQTAIWARTPWPGEFMKAHPPGVASRSGVAQLKCRPQPNGELGSCEVYSEDPAGVGFGAVALTLAPRFRLTKDAVKTLEATILLPIKFEPVVAPPWREPVFGPVRSFTRYAPAGPYYPDRAAREGVQGEVVVDCAVQADLRLANCAVASVVPAGMGFDDATLKMIEHGYMRAAPGDGDSASTYRFRVPFQIRGGR